MFTLIEFLTSNGARAISDSEDRSELEEILLSIVEEQQYRDYHTSNEPYICPLYMYGEEFQIREW